MAKILVKNNLAPAVYEFIIEAPMIAHKCQPGQFVMIRTDENSERIPLTIADFDREKGTITLIVQTVGNTTTHLCETFIVGDEILDVLGPLGMPSHMGKFGTVVCVGGGIGVAPVYPIARAYHKLGNKVISIIGARNKDLIIFKEKMEAVTEKTGVVHAASNAECVKESEYVILAVKPQYFEAVFEEIRPVLKDGQIVTNGGRVLGITATGKDLKEARKNAYEATEWITFANKYMRHDIGKAIDEA